MKFTNITSSEKKIYIVSFIISVVTYFMLTGLFQGNCAIACFDEKTSTGVSALLFFVYAHVGLYILRKNRLVLEIHNGIFDKDIKFYLYNGNKKVDFDKIRAYDDPSKREVKERLKSFLEKNSQLIKQSAHISFLGFKGKTEAYVENLLLNIAKS